MKRKIKLKLTKEQAGFISDALWQSKEEKEETLQNGEIPIEEKKRIESEIKYLGFMYYIFETLKFEKKRKKYCRVKDFLK